MQLRYNQSDSLEFSTKNCAILGSNWTWKSSLCKKIYELNTPENIQYIRAQRDLSINQWEHRALDNLVLEQSLSSYSLAKTGQNLSIAHLNEEKVKKYSNNIIQTDFNKNIEKFFRDDEHAHASASRNHINWNFQKPDTKASTIFDIWNDIFIDKSIEIKDWKIQIIFNKWEENHEYEIESLSDWERSALYMITKCIYAKENSIIIIDEWESHLNPAILYELWDSIEKVRYDCSFVYISHDINFIISRNNCTKFWIKEFNYPETWIIEKIKDDEISEELVLQILGSKKEKILFVESTEDKDKLLYQKVYPEFKVVPLWTCDNVISYTKILNNSSENYNKQYFWLIDRDFKTNEELESLINYNIFSLPVAEFENLFFRKEVIKFVFTYLWKQSSFNEKFELLETSVFNLKLDVQFKKDFYKNYVIQKFNKNLSNFELWGNYSFNDNYDEVNIKWQEISDENNFNNFLKILNAKSIKWKITELWLNYVWKTYRDQVLDIFNTEKSNEFKNIFLNFMPEIELQSNAN